MRKKAKVKWDPEEYRDQLDFDLDYCWGKYNFDVSTEIYGDNL